MHTINKSLKETVKKLKARNISEDVIRTIIKERIQDNILAAIYNNPKYSDLIFIGGTCLRKLYDLNRYSEDLDFVSKRKIDYEDLKEDLSKYFKGINFSDISFNIQESDLVSRLTVKFEILKEIGLSEFNNEKLHIKVESTVSDFDYNIIPFPVTLSSIPMVIISTDLETLFAGKINACIDRVYKKGETGIIIKGRDYYDLLWYMSKGIIPNTKALTNKKAFEELDEKVTAIKYKDLYSDLRNFFEDDNYIKIWCENFHKMYSELRKRY
jgi:predicted nucleotidyltransferase component of viral defense system